MSTSWSPPLANCHFWPRALFVSLLAACLSLTPTPPMMISLRTYSFTGAMVFLFLSFSQLVLIIRYPKSFIYFFRYMMMMVMLMTMVMLMIMTTIVKTLLALFQTFNSVQLTGITNHRGANNMMMVMTIMMTMKRSTLSRHTGHISQEGPLG